MAEGTEYYLGVHTHSRDLGDGGVPFAVAGAVRPLVMATNGWEKLQHIEWAKLHTEQGEKKHLNPAKEKFHKLKELHDNYIKTTAKRTPQDLSPDFHYLDKLFETLVKSDLHGFWSGLQPKDFVLILEALRPTCQEAAFLRCLSMPFHESFVSASSEETCYVHNMSKKEHRILTYPRKQYHVECTGAMHLYPSESCATDQAFVLRAMLDSQTMEVFQTPLGLAVVNSAWKAKLWHNRLAYVSHFTMVLLMLGFAHSAYREKMPHHWALRVYLGLFLLEVMVRAAEIAGAWCMYGYGSFIYGMKRHITGFWTFGYMAMHWVSLAITFHMLLWWRENREDTECTLHSGCWFHVHNMLFMSLVMAKCAGFLMRLLCWDNIGEASLPAINAVKARKTKYFLVFLVAFWLCAAAAFWVQPLDMENSITRICGELNHGHWVEELCRSVAFLDKIFNVAMMGQFGLAELEGTGKELNGTVNITENLIDGRLEREDWTPYHMGAEVWQVLVAFTVNILALNVFISIVSNEYNKFAGAAVAHLMHFRTHFIFRDLLAQIALERVLQYFGFDSESDQPKENHLIYIKSSEYNKFQGQEEMIRQVLDEVKALREELARVPKF